MSERVAEIVRDKVLAALERGTVPWQQGWDPTVGAPRSLSTGKPYTGVNRWLLTMAAAPSPWWGTMKAVNGLGGSVRKGERSTLVIFAKHDQAEDRSTGEVRHWSVLRYYNVFNASQCDNLPPEKVAVPTRPDGFAPLAECEAILTGYGAGPAVVHGGPDAFYRPAADTVTVPEREAFHSGEEYFSTLWHELTHSTGHPSRLDREGIATHDHRFGDAVYSAEELVAEMGSAILCAECGIAGRTFDNQAAYIAGWLRSLSGERARFVIHAAAQAEKAVNRIRGRQADSSEA